MLPTLAAFVLIALFGAAAYWQHARMLQREALGALFAAAAQEPPRPLPTGIDDWSAWQFRRVAIRGSFDAAHQILIDNRVDRGRVGFHVVTPLVDDRGRAVLVDRGFVAAGPSRAELPAVPVPAGQRVVHGRIALPPRYFELTGAPPAGVLWQNLDPAKFAQVTGIDVLPIIIEQDADDADDGLVRHWAAADAGADRNRSYMLQWLAFAALTLVLWIRFVVMRR